MIKLQRFNSFSLNSGVIVEPRRRQIIVKRRINRTGILIGIMVWLFIAWIFPNTVFPNRWFLRFNSQHLHLQQIKAHLETIEPQWREFQAHNPEFKDVELSQYTGGDGMFAAFGTICSTNEEASLKRLERFMVDTKPPRPVYLRAVQVLSPEDMEQRERFRRSKK